jgi:hypothetical protein
MIVAFANIQHRSDPKVATQGVVHPIGCPIDNLEPARHSGDWTLENQASAEANPLSNEELMRGTGNGLIQFFDTLATKGRMPRSTAANFKQSCATVLQTVLEGGWGDADIGRMDVEDMFSRFVILKAGSYTAGSFSSYKSRFYNGVNMYLGFLKDPEGWKPPVKIQAAVKRSTVSRTGSEGLGAADSASSVVVSASTPQPDVIMHHYPLRPGVRAVMSLPEDLTKREAARLGTFIQALAVDDQPTLSAATRGE